MGIIQGMTLSARRFKTRALRGTFFPLVLFSLTALSALAQPEHVPETLINQLKEGTIEIYVLGPYDKIPTESLTPANSETRDFIVVKRDDSQQNAATKYYFVQSGVWISLDHHRDFQGPFASEVFLSALVDSRTRGFEGPVYWELLAAGFNIYSLETSLATELNTPLLHASTAPSEPHFGARRERGTGAFHTFGARPKSVAVFKNGFRWGTFTVNRTDPHTVVVHHDLTHHTLIGPRSILEPNLELESNLEPKLRSKYPAVHSALSIVTLHPITRDVLEHPELFENLLRQSPNFQTSPCNQELTSLSSEPTPAELASIH